MAITFEGHFDVASPRADVYAFLADPRQFAPCLPTFHALEVRDERTAEVTVRVGVGKIRGNAAVLLSLRADEPPVRAAYEGKGRIMGSAFTMATTFDLAAGEQGGTRVNWRGELSLFGALVGLAGGLIRPVARKDIERMVASLQAALGGTMAGVVGA